MHKMSMPLQSQCLRISGTSWGMAIDVPQNNPDLDRSGSFLRGNMQGENIEKSLANAAVAAAICVIAPGAGDSIPYLAEGARFRQE